MPLVSLATKAPGPPDNAFQWYLHSSGVSLASGIQVTLGDGTGTPLYLGTDKIGVIGASGTTTIGTGATTTRAVNFADGAGTLFPALTSSAPETASSSTTPVTVSGFGVTLEASALYEFEMILFFKTAVAATAPQFTINGPTAQTDMVWFEVIGPYTVTSLLTTGGTRPEQQFTAWGTKFAATSSLPATNTYFPYRVRGFCKMTASTPAAQVTVDINSEGSDAVTLMGGSPMRFRKIN